MSRAWGLLIVAACLTGVAAKSPSQAQLPCARADFRKLMEVQVSSTDFHVTDSALVALGDEIVPCLESILQDGGRGLGLPECKADPERCQVGAVRALGELGTSRGKDVLVRFLGTTKRERPLHAAIAWVGNLRVAESRPVLLRLLKRKGGYTRSQVVIALGKIGDRSDFDVMLAATLSFTSASEVLNGAQGLEFLGDPRAIVPLENRAMEMADEPRQKELMRIIGRLSEKSASTGSNDKRPK